jgi:hypothetical protein
VRAVGHDAADEVARLRRERGLVHGVKERRRRRPGRRGVLGS